MPTCIASCQQSLSHGCVPARKHCRSAYLRCLPSTTGRGHVSARILRGTGAAPAGTASSGQPSPAVYIQERDCSTLQTLPPVDTGPGCVRTKTSVGVGTALTGVASHRQAVLDKYMHTCSVKLAQCIPVLAPADNQPQLCRASWHSAYWRCILLTTGSGCVPARILGRAR